MVFVLPLLKSSSSSLEKTLFLALSLLVVIGSATLTTTPWTTTTTMAQRLSNTPSFSPSSLGGEEEGDGAGRRIPPTTTFHPPSGSYPAPVAVRVAQSEEGGASVASCEKILVTVNGEALNDKVSYANAPVVLDREGVYVVKAVCLTGTVFGKENRAEYVVLPKNDDDEGSAVLEYDVEEREKESWRYFSRDSLVCWYARDAGRVRGGVSVLPRGVSSRRAAVRRPWRWRNKKE